MDCGDNPVMRVDPSGYGWVEFWKGVGLTLLAIVVVVAISAAVAFTAGAAGVGIGAAFAAGFTGATLVGTAGASVLAVTLLSSAFAGAFMASIIGLVTGGMTFTDGKIGWDWNGASEGFMWGAVTGALGGAGSNGLSNIGNGLGKVAKFLVQAGLNGVLSSSITTIQDLITGDVSWESSVLSFVFGAIGGGVGVISSKEGLKNSFVSFGLSASEATIGELIEFLKSLYSHSVTRLFKQQYAY